MSRREPGGFTRDRPFTVAQMREALAAFPDDALVLVSGYEGGFSDVSGLAEIDIARNVYGDDAWWNGAHDRAIDHRGHAPDPRKHVVVT